MLCGVCVCVCVSEDDEVTCRNSLTFAFLRTSKVCQPYKTQQNTLFANIYNCIALT